MNTGFLLLPFHVPEQRVFNEMYARDTSKKIRSAFSIKMHDGSYIGNFAPYGYQKDPYNKNHLLPDETSAQVVARIFSMAAAGMRPVDIAARLNSDQILPPALYRCANHPQLNADHYSSRKEWTPGTISKMLKNIVYLGHTAQGKTTKVSFKMNQTLHKPPQDWIIVKDTHEPLVSAELYELAQRWMKSRTCEKRGGFHNLFSGIARCASCGRTMSAVGSRKKGSPANLACGGYKLYGSGECTNHFIDYTVLYRVVLEELRAQLKLTPSEREDLHRELREQLAAEMQEGGRSAELRRLRSEYEKLDRIISQLYSDNLDGKLSGERFYRLLHKYETQGEAIQRKLNMSEDAEQAARKRDDACAKLASVAEWYENIPELNEDVLFALIDHIEVEQGRYEKTAHGRRKHQVIRIYFRFSTPAYTREMPL